MNPSIAAERRRRSTSKTTPSAPRPHRRARADATFGRLMARPQLTGWSSTERQSPDGAVEFEQRVRATRPLVELSERGALALGERYWEEVEAPTRRLVRAHGRGERDSSCACSAAGRCCASARRRPLSTSPVSRAASRSPAGSSPARRGGSITFAQVVEPVVELRATIDGFFPRLGSKPGGPPWTGALYRHVQRRIHTGVSRRYFRRLIAEGPR